MSIPGKIYAIAYKAELYALAYSHGMPSLMAAARQAASPSGRLPVVAPRSIGWLLPSLAFTRPRA